MYHQPPLSSYTQLVAWEEKQGSLSACYKSWHVLDKEFLTGGKMVDREDGGVTVFKI